MTRLRTALRVYFSQRPGLVWVLGAALVLRTLWLFFGAPGSLSHDELGYHVMVRQFLDRGVLGYYSTEPTAFVTPGYPLFMAAVYKLVALFGGGGQAQIAGLRTVQMLLGVATIAVIYELARKLLNDSRMALLAAVFVALYPSSFMSQERLLTETVFTFLFALYALNVVRLFKGRSMHGHIGTGVLLGVTTLVRPAVAPLIVLPYLVDFILRRDRKFLLRFAMALLMWAVVMTPWWVRNAIVYDQFIVFATQGGNPILRGADPWDPYDHVGPSVIEGVAPEDMSRVAKERIAQGFKEDPALWLGWFTYGKIGWLWGNPWSLDPFISKLMHWIVILGLGVPGVFWGLWRALKTVRDKSADYAVEGLGWLATIPLVITVLQLGFIPIPRYIYPLTALVSVFAAWVAIALFDFARSRFGGAPA